MAGGCANVEAEILLGCARPEMGPETVEYVREALEAEINWDQLLKHAAYHGVIPLLVRNLIRHFECQVPSEILHHLKDVSNSIAHQNLRFTGELLRLLRRFEEKKIRALPIKGPILAVTSYRNVSLRTFSDLDILVCKADMLRSKDLLISESYYPQLSLDHDEEAAYLSSHHDYKFARSDSDLLVDLQWSISQWSLPFEIDFEEIWKSHVVIPVGGRTVRTITPEILIVLLCVHGTKHRWSRLKWIIDISGLMTNSANLNWDRVLNESRRVGAHRMLLLGLLLTKISLGSQIPDRVERQIVACSSVHVIARRVVERLFTQPETNLLSEIKEGPLFFWSARERWRDKLSIAKRYLPEYVSRLLVPNQRDKKFIWLPPSLQLLYYLVHPVRLLSDYLRMHVELRTKSFKNEQ
jgi:hypothetical protein